MIVTGAAGFIGSCLISRLNQDNFNYIIAVDDFSDSGKNKNLENKHIQEYVEREDLFEWVKGKEHLIEFIFHIGARTDTAEFDKAIFDHLNVSYSKKIWELCVKNQIPLVYASSAATYGLGEHGYKDDESLIPQLKPLNPYGDSKQAFDVWALSQDEKPFFWAGLKFFNVYGPNEYHKTRMASVIYHAYHQINKTGKMKLFQSHHPDFKDGEQSRDFVYVKDVVDVIMHLVYKRQHSGIYNLGSGKARTFNDLAKAVFKALEKEENISYIPTPEDIRDKYQYFTEADMRKIQDTGYDKTFTSLEEGVNDYVCQYLSNNRYY